MGGSVTGTLVQGSPGRDPSRISGRAERRSIRHSSEPSDLHRGPLHGMVRGLLHRLLLRLRRRIPSGADGIQWPPIAPTTLTAPSAGDALSTCPSTAFSPALILAAATPLLVVALSTAVLSTAALVYKRARAAAAVPLVRPPPPSLPFAISGASKPPGEAVPHSPSCTAIVWFRSCDLRLRDHEPLVSANADPGADHLLPVFIFDPRDLEQVWSICGD